MLGDSQRVMGSGRRRLIWAAGGMLGLFVLVNVLVGVLYSGKSYPNTKVAGRQIGSVAAEEAQTRLQELELLPEDVQLRFRGESDKTTLRQLGVTVDYEKSAQIITDEQRSWLPVVNLFTDHNMPLAVEADQSKIEAFTTDYSASHDQAPVNARIVQNDRGFVVEAEKNGYEFGVDQMRRDILNGLSRGRADITLRPQVIRADVTQADLQAKAGKVQAQQRTRVTVKFGSKSKTFSTAEKADWFYTNGIDILLSEGGILDSLTRAEKEFGMLAGNRSVAISDISAALKDRKPLDFALERAPQPGKAYSYCTAVRGLPESFVSELSGKLATVLTDKRGWGVDGQVHLARAENNCDFTVWLSAAEKMPSFGAICDEIWSCRIGPDVVINIDRWQNATDPWNASGGSLEDYRVMVINHEVGHWFGLHHTTCPGPGQPANVMQQQSIDLQGCVFNPWPRASELELMRRAVGL